MLPDGDGRDLARELRSSGSEVPIIMLTARGTELERVVGLELGADDYVVKPFSGAEVIARMRAVLRRGGAAGAGAPGGGGGGPVRGGSRPPRGVGSPGGGSVLRQEVVLLLVVGAAAGGGG